MLGVANWRAHPPGLKSLIALVKARRPGLSVSQDVPRVRPESFVTIDRVGGSEDASGTVSVPLFAFDCYALDAGGAEGLCEELLATLKSAQFTSEGDVQFRGFTLVGGPHNYPHPDITDRRRWQFSATFGISNRRK
jgi:hypothetical protein